ncbi:class I SAM-dependent methyltransferase [Altererythrobacter sp. BO-6]|uniref:class I SAM-dependent methyltransferase n=1 Tax=Altererythrobacter sp. BO-6 TaxID=2604537 RepID=UPI0013E1C080|nr:class I SAM-dependent methyltransferase [Altererythrobacter sp. BO-6]QIG54448.1 class I SAM-dependent methyltransferase [Altererythrobacter sp. BO-6]
MMRKLFSVTALALAILPTAPAWADEVDDAIASASRTEADRALDAGRMPAEVLRFSAVEPGDTIVDFMAGGGYYSALLADLTGKKGMVYAINPVRFHPANEWEGRLAAHSNIRPMAVDPRAMVLAPGSVDMIFAHLTFHDLYWESEQYAFPRLDVDAMLANWFAAVKPGGEVIIVDHVGPTGDPREVTDKLHRIAPQTVIAAMGSAGFELAGQSDVLRRSDDDLSKNVFDEAVRGKTDRFVMKFIKRDS